MSRRWPEGDDWEDDVEMHDASNVSGIVLAAGAGLRYGMPKVLAHQGEWLRLAVDALVRGGCLDVVVVLGSEVVDVPAPARAVVARDWSRGISASLRAGVLATANADLVVVRLVDTPDVGPDAVRRVLEAAEDTGLARATYDGRPGHPVALARRHLDPLLAMLDGDRGARTFLAGRSDVVDVECGDLAGGGDIDERSREEHDAVERSREEHDAVERSREEHDAVERSREEHVLDER